MGDAGLWVLVLTVYIGGAVAFARYSQGQRRRHFPTIADDPEEPWEAACSVFFAVAWPMALPFVALMDERLPHARALVRLSRWMRGA